MAYPMATLCMVMFRGGPGLGSEAGVTPEDDGSSGFIGSKNESVVVVDDVLLPKSPWLLQVSMFPL